MSDKSLLDQYYTKPEVAEYYSNFIKERFGDDCSYFEPSAGKGAFSSCFKNITSIDIEPKFDGCVRGDFLSYTPDLRNKIVVGNPPFGFCSSLALKFINHSMRLEAEAVCFILPKTFKKPLFHNNINLNYSCSFQQDVINNAFILDEKEYNVPCVFQIWERKEVSRTPILVDETKYFNRVSKDCSKYAIRRVGANAGKVFITDSQSESSNYFVNMSEDTCNKLKECYPHIKEVASWTAGVRSITLKELAYVLDRRYIRD